MISYREAISADCENIALLHAQNWQLHYRGSMSDEYLDNQIFDERKGVWKKRFDQLNKNQSIIVVEEDNKLVGFSCVFYDNDSIHGTLLDNLHVHTDYVRKGIGKVLMKKCSDLILQNSLNSKMYLWVLTGNHKAISFYDSLGGIKKDTKAWKTPDNKSIDTYRYVWNDLRNLANLL